MFDFRYHALSLVAVFLALSVGLLLGIAIGDAGLVSSGERKLREGLSGDVREARAEAARLRAELEARERYEQQAYPLMVAGRLAQRRIGLIALGGGSDRVVRAVRAALTPSGGELKSVSVVRLPLDLEGIAERAAGTRYARLRRRPALVEPLARRIGLQYVTGGRLLRRVRAALLSRYPGEFEGLDAVVLYRDRGELGPAQARLADAFEQGLIDGLTELRVPVVGVETTATAPSQIGWFRDRDVTTVDDVDELAGRAALVFALAGETGAFGRKPTADRLLPRPRGS